VTRPIYAATLALSISLTACTQQVPPPSPNLVVVAVPAKAGAVQGKTENSDAFLWGLFAQFTAPNSANSPRPVQFETWASDKDTFSFTPHWPSPGEPLDFHPSVLGALSTPGLLQSLIDSNQSLSTLLKQPIDVNCEAPPGAAVGGFPTTGTPPPCIAEQVARNRKEYDYIVNNHLNTQAGLALAYKNGVDVEMPIEAIGLKGDWVPVEALQKWVPQAGDPTNIRKLYFTATVDKIEFALVAMHVASRQNPNWVWGTFEHQLNPGRCDYIGCFDTFGVQVPAVAPNRALYNSQYGACAKTPELKALLAKANLSPVWENYCLKSSQVDFVASDGTPYALGNSVIEGIVGNGTVAISSCITCHYYASFGATGAVTAAARKILPFNPAGNPIPGVLDGSHRFAFNWGVLLAPAPTATFVTFTAVTGTPITPATMVGSSGVGGPYTFSATGLPPGLSISSRGIISGTPTTSGTYNYTVTVKDSAGNTGTVNLSLTVNAAQK
jgi:Putative Ig domain